jgi:hypothetical protein
MRTAALLEQVMLFELTPFVVAVRSPFDSGNARTSNTSVDISDEEMRKESSFTTHQHAQTKLTSVKGNTSHTSQPLHFLHRQ